MKLIHPSNIIISGPTGSGKTQFVARVIQLKHLMPFPTRIIWLFSEWQHEYDSLTQSNPEIEFLKGFPDKLLDSFSPYEKNISVLDGQMVKLGKK